MLSTDWKLRMNCFSFFLICTLIIHMYIWKTMETYPTPKFLLLIIWMLNTHKHTQTYMGGRPTSFFSLPFSRVLTLKFFYYISFLLYNLPLSIKNKDWIWFIHVFVYNQSWVKPDFLFPYFLKLIWVII